MKNRNILLTVTLLLVLSNAVAQEDRKPDREEMRAKREQMKPPSQLNAPRPKEESDAREMMMVKIVSSPRFAEQFGLSEEQSSHIRDALGNLRDEMGDLHKQMEASAREQAELLVTEPFDEAALMEAIERTGKIRTEMAKVRIRPLVVLREVLTGDQLRAVTAKMQDHRKGLKGGHGEGDDERRGPEQLGDEENQKLRRERWERIRKERGALKHGDEAVEMDRDDDAPAEE